MDHAAFARRMAETTQRLRQTQQQLALSARPGADIQTFAAQTQRLARRLQAFAGVMIGLALVGIGSLLWLGVIQSTEHAALLQALHTETQTLATQTLALLETLRRGQP